MSCKRCSRALTAYLDGELDVPTATFVRGHLRGCALCRAEASDAATVRDALRAMPTSAEPSANCWTNIAARLAEAETRAAAAPRWVQFVQNVRVRGHDWYGRSAVSVSMVAALVVASVFIVHRVAPQRGAVQHVAWRADAQTEVRSGRTPAGRDVMLAPDRTDPRVPLQGQTRVLAGDVSAELAADSEVRDAAYTQQIAALWAELMASPSGDSTALHAQAAAWQAQLAQAAPAARARVQRAQLRWLQAQLLGPAPQLAALSLDAHNRGAR